MNSNLKFFIAKIVFSALFIFLPNFLFGQKQIISTSILKIESYKNFRGNYNFLVGGHLYGNPSNSTWPASSLLGNIFPSIIIFKYAYIFVLLKRMQ